MVRQDRVEGWGQVVFEMERKGNSSRQGAGGN